MDWIYSTIPPLISLIIAASLLFIWLVLRVFFVGAGAPGKVHYTGDWEIDDRIDEYHEADTEKWIKEHPVKNVLMYIATLSRILGLVVGIYWLICLFGNAFGGPALMITLGVLVVGSLLGKALGSMLSSIL